VTRTTVTTAAPVVAAVAVPAIEGALVFGVVKTFRIKEKWFSLSGAMEVTDADLGAKVFKVKPKILTILDSIKITDMKGIWLLGSLIPFF